MLYPQSYKLTESVGIALEWDPRRFQRLGRRDNFESSVEATVDPVDAGTSSFSHIDMHLRLGRRKNRRLGLGSDDQRSGS
jgi:hypothetical protein